MSAKIPGSVPRNCDTTYRGYLTREKPKRITLESGRELVKARMGVSMPASTVSPEERDSCTEWVNVVAMNPAQMERLERCQPQELVCVSGPVTLHTYRNRAGETKLDRTIMAEYVRSASASMPVKPKADEPGDKPDELPGGEPETGAGDGAAAEAAATAAS